MNSLGKAVPPTSVCPGAGTAGRVRDGDVVVRSDGFRQSNGPVRFNFHVEQLASEGEQRVVLAFPPLQEALLVAVILVHFTPHAFTLSPQTFFGGGDQQAVAGGPAQVQAAAQSSHQTQSCGLVGEGKRGICRDNL